MAIAETPRSLAAIIEKLNAGIDGIDPKDPRYAAIFQNLPKGTEDVWIDAIKEVAVLASLPPKEYGREVLRIAKSSGLLSQGAHWMPRGDYLNLALRANALRGIIQSSNMGGATYKPLGGQTRQKR